MPILQGQLSVFCKIGAKALCHQATVFNLVMAMVVWWCLRRVCQVMQRNGAHGDQPWRISSTGYYLGLLFPNMQCVIADMEFLETDTEEDRKMKLRILEIYNKWVADPCRLQVCCVSLMLLCQLGCVGLPGLSRVGAKGQQSCVHGLCGAHKYL